ncbi:MAG: hypothetical protein KJN63_03560, partial [Acidimicrobiia bacterium]|nr:hypothetical protein [Acidimicrobiia bacterium]
GFLNGPTGPAEKARWNEPITWHEGLRDASVVIPQGERFGGVVTAFCSVVEAGSTVVVKAVREPVVVLLLLGLIGYLLLLFFRQTTWSPVTTQPLRARRAAGQILRSSLRFAGQRPFILLAIGLVAIPVSLATSLLQALVQQIPLARDLLSLAGERSETGVGLALLIGGVGSSLSYAIIAGAVAAVIDQPHPSRASWRTAIGPLLSAFVRAAGIVVALFITVVGLPWAIRQIVRYQLIPQAVVLEGAGGKDALGRSSELVRGRWWWTATVFAVLQFVIGIVGMMLALALLVAFPGVPLWLFGIFSSVALVLLMPIFGAVMAFVYGEHIARREARSTAPAAKVAT